jgi:hypothetical protein
VSCNPHLAQKGISPVLYTPETPFLLVAKKAAGPVRPWRSSVKQGSVSWYDLNLSRLVRLGKGGRESYCRRMGQGMTAGFLRGAVVGAILTASILALAHLGPAPSPTPRFLSNFPWSPASEAAKLGEGKTEGGQEAAGGPGPLGSQEKTNEHHHAGPPNVVDDEEKDSGIVEDDSMHEPEAFDEDEDDEDENDEEDDGHYHGHDSDSKRKGRKKRAVLDSDAVTKKKKPSALLEPDDIPDACKQMWMSKNDMSGFIRLLRSDSVEQYLEYGGGGSTLCAASIAKNGTLSNRGGS